MKIFKRSLLILLVIVIAYVLRVAWQSINIISAVGAKNLCSCVFLSGRTPEDVISNELKIPFVEYGTFEINYADSSATGSVLGLAKRKAIFRKGLGCTLIAGLDEKDLRGQKVNLYQRKVHKTDSIAWPQGDKLPDTLPSGLNPEKLQLALDNAFVEVDSNKLNQKRTRAIVVLYDGQIVAERYGQGFTKNSRQTAWSMAKSITNALVGILVKQGKLKLDEPAPWPDWKNDNRKEITLNDLMHMSSGLTWAESYSAPPKNATIMLYTSKDMGLYAAKEKLESRPGAVFEYSSGTTNIISRIVRDQIGDESYYTFPYQELFEKLGMHSIILEPDAGGTFVGSSYAFATARDFARFGLLFYNDGVWGGERILPEGWTKYSSTPTTGAKQGEYGAQWWTNAGEKGDPAKRPYPDVPTDAYTAVGHEEQYIFIVPSKKLVVVRLGLAVNDFDINRLVSEVIASLPQ